MGSYTPNYNIYKPNVGEVGWGEKVSSSFDIIDSELGVAASGSSPNFMTVDIYSTDNSTHLSLTGDPANTMPSDGDLWWTGSELYFFDGSVNTNLLIGIGEGADPSGANTQIQFNNFGSFGGHASLTTDKMGSLNCLALTATSLNVSGSTAITDGTIDGTIIGGSSPAAVTGTSISDGTVTITGGVVTGLWNDLGYVTTVDINGGTIDGVIIGGSDPQTGTFENVNIESPGGVAHVSMTGDPDGFSPSDGDLWWTGTELKFFDGTTTYNLLVPSGVATYA